MSILIGSNNNNNNNNHDLSTTSSLVSKITAAAVERHPTLVTA